MAAVGGRDPDVPWQRSWDGRWRLVLFDIPEQKLALRVRLRRKLHELGFGFLQNSVWVSPDSTETLTAAMAGITASVETFSLMEARPCGGESDADIVSGAWDFGRINRGYRLYLEILRCAPGRLSSETTRRAWFDAEWKAWSRAVRGRSAPARSAPAAILLRARGMAAAAGDAPPPPPPHPMSV